MSGKPLLTCLFLFLLICLLTIAPAAQQEPMLSRPIDDSVRFTVAGSKHPLAQPQFDIGSVDPGTRLDRMLLVLSPSPQQEIELQKFLDSQQDRSSPNYHHWLTPEEFALKFGPAPQDIATVKNWLEQKGFVVGPAARSGRWLEFSGTAGQVEHAFATPMRSYVINGESHIANAANISVPEALSPVVRGVVSLHNFFKKPMRTHYVQAQLNGDGTYTPIAPEATFNTSTGEIHALTPGDYASIYQINQLYGSIPALNGAGVTIAIVARSGASLEDFSDFRRITGLPAGSLVNTGTMPLLVSVFDVMPGDDLEADLDAEWAGAVAPGAIINVVVSSSTATSDGVDLSSAYIVDHNLAPVMSVSFGACESALGAAENAFYNGLWEQAAAEGISVMVASGDSGAAGCDLAVQTTAATGGTAVSGLASTPFNTAVGGTEFQENGSAAYWSSTNSSTGVSVNGYIPEVAWNESCDPTLANSPCASAGVFILASTGGGASAIYPKPVWQSGVFGIPNDQARDIPDVSLSAAFHDGYVICFQLSCESNLVGIVSGTSASSPSFAGMMAIVNQAAGRQGLANYKLYELAQRTGALCNSSLRTNPSVPPPSTCLFNDVEFGFNSVPGQLGYLAGSQFDLTTGLGSVNAFNLVNAWKAIALQPTTVALSSNNGATINATHGQPVPLSVAVTGALPSPAPGGGVALIKSPGGDSVDAVQVTGAASGNVATFDGTFSNLPGGIYNLWAHYSGDGQFAPADSNTVSVNISPEASNTVLRTFAVDSNGFPVAAISFPYGSFMDLHADVSGASGQGIPTGNVSFFDGNASFPLGTSQVNLNGESEFRMFGGNSFPAALTVGTHNLSANYSGDSSFASGSSAPLTVTITKGNPTVNLALFSNSLFVAFAPGRLDAFMQSIGNIFPTGTVQFFDGSASLGTVQLSSTEAVLNPIFDTEGTHSVSATYSGDANYNPATSAAFVVTVRPPFSVVAQLTSATIPAGQSVAFNASVGPTTQPTTFTGTVTLTCSTSSPAITCSVNPASVDVTPTSNFVPITVKVSTTTAARLHPHKFPGWPMALAGAFAITLGLIRRKSSPAWAAIALLMVLGAVSCGGGGSAQPAPTPVAVLPPTHATVVVTGTSGSHVNTATFNLTITH